MHTICVAKMLDNTQSIICAFCLAAGAPHSPYRHVELCGVALRWFLFHQFLKLSLDKIRQICYDKSRYQTNALMGRRQSSTRCREPPVGARRCGEDCVTGPGAAVLKAVCGRRCSRNLSVTIQARFAARPIVQSGRIVRQREWYRGYSREFFAPVSQRSERLWGTGAFSFPPAAGNV